MLPDRWCILCILSTVTLLPIGSDGFTFDLFQSKNTSKINATTISGIGSTTNRPDRVQASINLPLSTKRISDRPAVSSTSPSPDLGSKTTEVPQIVSSLPNKREVSSYPPVSRQEESTKMPIKSTIVHLVPYKTLNDGYVTEIDVESDSSPVFQSNDYTVNTGGSNRELVPSTFSGTSQNTLIYPENSWNNYALHSYKPTPWDIRSIYEYPMYSVPPVRWVTPRMYDVAPVHPWRYGQFYNSYNSLYSPPLSTETNSFAWNRYRRQVLPEYNGRYTPFFSHPYYPQSYYSQYIYPFTKPTTKTYKNEFADFEYIPYTKQGGSSGNVPSSKNVEFSKPHKEHPHLEGKSGKEKEDEEIKPKNKIHFLVPQKPSESESEKANPEKEEGSGNSMTRYQSQYPFSFNNHHGHPIRHGYHNPYYQHYFTY